MTEDQAEVHQLCLEEMAEFCLATGMSPSVFWGLTMEEYNAFLIVNARNNKKQGGS